MFGLTFGLMIGAWGATARADDLSGAWASPLGVLNVSQKSDHVVGAGQGLCGSPESGHLLETDVLEDSLSGQVYVCQQGCDKGPPWVPVLLLVAADGKSLSGTSTLPKGCKAGLGPNGSLVLRRQAPSRLAGVIAPKPKTPPAPAPTPQPVPEVVETPAPPQPPPSTTASTVAPVAPVASRPPPKKPTPEAPAAPVAPPKELAREDPTARAKAIELARDGAAFQQEGKFEQARHRFQQAIDLDPFYAEGFNGVGVTYFARNDLGEALRWYKRALGADPSFGDAYYNMACVYSLQKRKALALRYLRIAFHNGFTSRDVMRDDPDLAGLHGAPAFEALLGEAQ